MKTIYSICLAAIVLCLSAPVLASDSNSETMSVSEAVLEALKRNPSIREAQANIAAAEESVKSVRADMLPHISAGYRYTSLKEEPVMKTAQGDIRIAHQRQYNWDVTLVQPLFTGFALSSRLDIARLDAVAGAMEKDQVSLDVARGVRGACHGLLLARKLLMVSDHEVETLTAHKRDAELFFNQGLIPPNDRLKAEVALSNALQEHERVRARVRKAEIRINRLLGRPLEATLAIEDVGDITNESYDLAELYETALKDRPIIKLLDISMRKLGLSETIAKSAWYPHVSLVGSYEYVGDGPSARNNSYSNSDNSFVAVQAEWNFWRSGKTRAEVNRARRRMKSLEARIESITAQVREEVQGALLDSRVALKNIDTAEKALAQARENWRITDLQYREQMATSTDVLDARAFVTQADTNYYRAVYGYLDAVAGLDHAIGKRPGG